MKSKKLTKTSAKKAKVIKREELQKRTIQDIKTATLVTSGLANLFILIGWMVLQVTTQYNDQVVALLFR